MFGTTEFEMGVYRRMRGEKYQTDQEETRFYRVYSKFCTNMINLIFHVLMLAIFEPLFFFTYATGFETSTYLGSLDSYTSEITDKINEIPSSSLDIIRELFFGAVSRDDILRQIEKLKQAALEAKSKREDINHDRVIYSVCLAIGLFLLGCIFIFLAKLRKVPINWKKILFENFLLIILLGLYEFVFFETVVIKYKICTADEVNYHIITNIIDSTDILNNLNLTLTSY